ncbi:hypothetical protein [Enterobacter kobei]|uniref:hypothetical protein n=1 Tax=Enterobacter kobei TaxID=208224 RepID=UPI001FD56253|nr:hypothetical protein [Enterobacter kobei]
MSQHAWKKAQRYGIALQGETLFYSTDATLEHLLEFASVAPECTCFTRLPPQQFAEKLGKVRISHQTQKNAYVSD